MKIIIKIITAMLLITAGTQKANSQSAELDDYIFYEIGGASAYNRASGRSSHDIIDLSLNASLSLSCGEFSLEENIDQLVEEFSSVGDNIVQIIEVFAADIINNLPLLILREVNPNLANLVENIVARYEELYRISVANCEEIQRSIIEEDRPYASWISLGRQQNYANNTADGMTATQANEDRDTVAPVVWINGLEAGTTNPINLVGDLVVFGYETLSAEGSAITEIWESSEIASEYAVRVLGEQTINFEAGNDTVPGTGVLPEVEETFIVVSEQLNELLQNQNATPDELREASSSYISITPRILEAIRQEPRGAQFVYTSRLASEIATARETERLLALRRVILTARREPHVANTPAWDHINDILLPEIEQEIDLLIQQERISKTLVSSTSQTLLEAAARRNQRGDSFLGAPNNDESEEGFPKNE